MALITNLGSFELDIYQLASTCTHSCIVAQMSLIVGNKLLIESVHHMGIASRTACETILLLWPYPSYVHSCRLCMVLVDLSPLD